jgi:hypothetical protein
LPARDSGGAERWKPLTQGRLPDHKTLGRIAKMEHAPVHIVDTSIVPLGDHQRFLALVRDEIVPVMRDAGVECLSVLASSPEIGEPVEVQVTWRVADHQAWNVARRDFFLDPRWHAASAAAAKLRTGGKRRFLYPAE